MGSYLFLYFCLLISLFIHGCIEKDAYYNEFRDVSSVNNSQQEFGDGVLVEDENGIFCKDDIGLEGYPKELKSAFLNSKLSKDCIIQDNEKKVLGTAVLLFNYGSLEQIKNNLLEINGLSSLLEILFYYDPYSKNSEKNETINNVFVNSTLKEKDRIYTIQVAHILWLENENVVAWSLEDYSKEELNYLLQGDASTEWSRTIISDEWPKAFPVTFTLIKSNNSTQKVVVEKIILWETKNFFHSSKEHGWEVYETGLTRQTLEDYFRERVVSCHSASHILISMLRSINIPAYEKHFKGHGVVFIPTLNLYVHGDYIADFTVHPNLLMTEQELESYVNSEGGYLEFWKGSPYRFVQLKRDGNKLYVSGAIPDGTDIDFVVNNLDEYNVTLERGGIGWLTIKSDRMDIKELNS